MGIDKKATGRRIQRMLADRGIVVAELQEQMGLESPQSIYKWLNSRSLPSLNNLCLLARLLSVSIEDIVVFRADRLSNVDD